MAKDKKTEPKAVEPKQELNYELKDNFKGLVVSTDGAAMNVEAKNLSRLELEALAGRLHQIVYQPKQN
jgi:hypothetical protein